MSGTIIEVRGGGSDGGALDRFGEELASRGARVEVVREGGTSGLSGGQAAPACRALARHGVIVVTSLEGIEPGEGTVLIRTDIAEITDAARLDAFMRRLELSGNVPPPSGKPSPEEEEAVRARLRELGYL
ncbi:MAG TPA: hypothetical protein PLP78_03190 [Candidatus Fermentibacter daniensis]|nr:hypothetical protein [Candidatus Fermentibacter daniensis]